MARRIGLTRGLQALVDDEDYDRLSVFSWYVVRGANTFYAARRGPRDARGYRRTFYMHREVLGIGFYERGGVEADHINRDGLDNRRENLRVVSHRENRLNSDRVRGEKPCALCGKLFKPSKPSGRFCSASCARKQPGHGRSQRVLPERTCPTCRRVFRPHNHRTKYCSLSCRRR